jgi:hypothetical protein
MQSNSSQWRHSPGWRHANGPAPQPGSPDYLLWLVRRTATHDRAAFAELYDALFDRLFRETQSVVSDPQRASAIITCAFVEIWSMARFHTSSGTDVSAWLTEIVGRRTADRQGDALVDTDSRTAAPGARRHLWWATVADGYDRQMAHTLAALLGQPRVGRSTSSPADLAI